MTTMRDAVAQLAARIVFDDEATAEMQADLAQCIEQAIVEFKHDQMQELITRTLHAALQRRIEDAIEGWWRTHNPPQPYQPEVEDTGA